ncbi:MAG: ribosome hibernation-promoting factor, HPF/YfiA family [Candidatus Anammoxibacter sp.]
MNVNVHGKHIEITHAIQEYAKKKAAKIEKFFERIGDVQMVLDIEGDSHVAEMIVKVMKGPTLIGVETKGDMYASIDLVVDKLERQLTKYKEKLQSRKKRKSDNYDENISEDEEIDEVD